MDLKEGKVKLSAQSRESVKFNIYIYSIHLDRGVHNILLSAIYLLTVWRPTSKTGKKSSKNVYGREENFKLYESFTDK